ncbi:hypothetical protein [Paenisporosarcina sp. OV554]|uniref:hypothetical protein n=1 Tax=Paenisporosarcina sp. OV554 TaxID=2135694 RepID=UPI001E44A0EE|nr:hypothetical protein [Paenisporosarcina sp. OV554]
MIKLFYKTKLKSAEKESILINLSSKWILLIYRKIWGFAVFLFKLYSKATADHLPEPILPYRLINQLDSWMMTSLFN